MKTFKMGVIALLLAGVLAACGSPALKSNIAEAGHGGESGGQSEGAATKPAEGGHETTPATKAAEGGHETTPAPATKAVVTPVTAVKGQVTYLERIALPEDAVVTVQIRDISKADAIVKLAEQVIKPGTKAPPYVFEVQYDTSKVNPKALYVVYVTIEQGGKQIFGNSTLVPVITNGAPLDTGVITLTKVS